MVVSSLLCASLLSMLIAFIHSHTTIPVNSLLPVSHRTEPYSSRSTVDLIQALLSINHVEKTNRCLVEWVDLIVVVVVVGAGSIVLCINGAAGGWQLLQGPQHTVVQNIDKCCHLIG